MKTSNRKTKTKSKYKTKTKIKTKTKTKTKSKSKSVTKQSNFKKDKFIYELEVNPSNENTKHIQNALKTFRLFLYYYNIYHIKNNKNQTGNLSIKDTDILKSNNHKVFFICITTIPYTNHPFLLYGFFKNNKFKIMIPLGNKGGQVNIKLIKNKLKPMKSLDKIALLHLLQSSLKIREFNIFKYTTKLINTSESLYNCSNIKVCRDSITKIRKMEIYENQKILLSHEIYTQIKDIIYKHLKKYFEYLKSNKLKEAKDYLIKYFSKIYYDTKPLLGHLLIFIDIYKLIYDIKKSI